MAELPRGLNAGESVHLAGFTIQAVPAAHNELEQDQWGRHRYLGYVVEAGSWTIYHAGDTRRYEGMEDWLLRRPIDIALLPINGDRPERRVAGNLNGREAATLARDMDARMVIPCHYEMFEFNTASPDEFVATARSLGQPHRVLRCGERWSSSELQRTRATTVLV
jgi:L-ascorbate metabolism protein UlaG (beta-lactamase superfamily)